MTTTSTPSLIASLAARGYRIDAQSSGSQVTVLRRASAMPRLHHPLADRFLVLSALGVIVLGWVGVLAVLAASALLLVPSASTALADIAGQGAALAACLMLVGVAPYAVRGQTQRRRSTQHARRPSQPAGRR